MLDTVNREIVHKWYNTHDRTLMDSECIWEIAEGFPYGGIYTSSQAVFDEFFPRLLGEFDTFNAEVDEILDTGSVVLGLGRYQGRTKATSTQVSIPFAHLWKVRNGRIIWFRNYTDTLLLFRALQA